MVVVLVQQRFIVVIQVGIRPVAVSASAANADSSADVQVCMGKQEGGTCNQ